MNYQNRYNLPEELISVVDRELGARESVIWSGQPVPHKLSKTTLPTVLFGIPWTAFAIFWTTMAASGTRKSGSFAWIFPLWGVPFILIGLWMLTSPFWIFQKAKRTAYILTNQRAMIIGVGWLKKISVRSFEPDAMKDIQRIETTDGSGDLIFTKDVSTGSRGRSNVTSVGFLGIQQVKSVEETIRQLVRKNTANSD